MKHFRKIADYDVSQAVAQLDAHPELWNTYDERTATTTFRGTSDIWLRYRRRDELNEAHDYAVPHFAEFYPAWHVLRALHVIVFDLMSRVQAVYLGGILITRIPPGGVIAPHHDRGSWHAEWMNCKVYVPLKANKGCLNRCADETLIIGAGEAVTFDNLITHSVENRGDTERVTLIVCMRTEE